MIFKNKSYSRAFKISLGIHVLLLAVLVIDISFDRKETMTMTATAPKVDVVQAVSVNSQVVNDALAKLKEERAAEKAQQRNEQQQLKKQAEEARKTRKQEQARLEKLKKEAVKEKLEQQVKLKKLKQEQATEQKRIADLKVQQKKTVEKQKKLAADQLADEAKRDKQEQDRLRAEAQQTTAQNQMNEAQLAQLNTELQKYKNLILAAISQQWLVPPGADENLTCKLNIQLAPGGAVIDVKLAQSSGDPALDRSAIAAVFKASPLPVSSETDVFNKFRHFNLTLSPKKVISAG